MKIKLSLNTIASAVVFVGAVYFSVNIDVLEIKMALLTAAVLALLNFFLEG